MVMNATVPETMWACLLYGKEDLRLERIPVPVPRDGELLVQVEAALTCGTDLKVLLRGYHERMITPPAVFGHEFAGLVVSSKNKRFPVGSRVVAANSAPCGRCYFCELGKPNLCREVIFANGAYAEYTVVPARIANTNCHSLPDELPAFKAALVEPLACAVKGVEDVDVSTGESVLVIGCGPLGLMLARLSVLAGAEVTCVDILPARLDIARQLGAANTVAGLLSAELAASLRADYSKRGLGFDCVIEAVGRPETWNLAPELVRPGGRVNLFGGCPRGSELRVDTTRLHYDEIRIYASFHHTPETVRKALELVETSQVPALTLIGEGRSLLDLSHVLAEMRAGSAPPKTAILPQLPQGIRLSPAELEEQAALSRSSPREPAAMQAV
ncbi:MAG: zinc-binding dehydrogenase [Deltaproteobacteria bacterium]|nr:zinc-binding dehydrogenase [Deltaproteobacteria bacterium]MBW2072523.1 zinc-binding dehydrogenase [Deltaproteobacteria bacterium]